MMLNCHTSLLFPHEAACCSLFKEGTMEQWTGNFPTAEAEHEAFSAFEHTQTRTGTDTDTEDDDNKEVTFVEESGSPLEMDMPSYSDAKTNWDEGQTGKSGKGGRERKSYAENARMFKLRRNLDQLDSLYAQKEDDVLRAREQLKACHQHIAELQAQRESVEEDIERQKKEENSVAVFRLRAQHNRLCVELQREEELEALTSLALKEHELELCQLEVKLGSLSELRQEVQQEEQDFYRWQEERRARQIQQESVAAKETVLRRQQAKAKRKALIKEQKAQQQRVLEQAQAGQLKASQHLRTTMSRIRQKEAEKEEQKKEQMKRRMEAVISLKNSITATQESLRDQQAQARARAQRQSLQDRQLRESLQAQGLNSYKEMYQHQRRKALHKTEEELSKRQEARRMEIISKILVEEELEKRHKKQQTWLLPAPPAGGRRPAGRGKSHKRILQGLYSVSADSKQQRHVAEAPREGPCEMTDSRSSDEYSDSVDDGGVDGDQKEEEDRGIKESLALPEFMGLWDQTISKEKSTSDEESAFKSLSSSVLQKDLISQITGKRQTLVSQKKGSSKRELKRPFTSKPEVIHFKDFDIGKVYKKKVTLINVTYSTNHCKLLGVTAELLDFVSINFELPGPMSSGMACEMEAVFKPVVEKDLEGEVRFASAAGLFSVPVKCTQKRCEMAVDSSLIDFGTHVVGQTISRPITLTNRGALGTRYFLISCASDNHLRLQSTAQSSYSTQGLAEIGESGAPACQESDVKQDPEKIRSEENCQETESPGRPAACGSAQSGPEALTSGPSLTEHVNQDPTKDDTHQFTEETSEIHLGEVREGDIGPFGSVKIYVTFTPTLPGEASMDFQINFSHLSCLPIPVTVQGMAVSMPVSVTKPDIDLKICFFDRLYQDSIEVQSRASTALRLTFEVCKELKNHMEILPKTGYIQANSTFHAQLRFLPRRSLPVDAKHFFDKETGVLEVPLTVQVADQVCPVPFTIHAVITSSNLHFDQIELDFGHCSVYESVRASVRLINTSLLPQDFGFMGVPKYIDIQPNHGFGTLLPQETLQIDIIFSAPRAGEFNFHLNCKSGINRDFALRCRAIGVCPSLELSHSLVQFAATAIGDKCIASLYVVNSNVSLNECKHSVRRVGSNSATAAGPRLFAFAPPEGSEISITPTSGRVLPGQRRLIQVTFRPSLSDDVIKAEAVRLACLREEERMQELQKSETEISSRNANTPVKMESQAKMGGKASPNSSSGRHSVKKKNCKMSEDFAAGQLSLFRSFEERHSKLIIPCFVSNGDQEPGEKPSYSPHNMLYLELHCPAVQPSLLLLSNNGLNNINFHQVALGHRVVVKIKVQNISQETIELKPSLLDLRGPFLVLNAMRPLSPGATHTILLAFTPTKGKKYREALEIHSCRMTLELMLFGEGIEPLVTCSHCGPVIDFGHVLAQESACQVFQLQNDSALPVKFNAVLDSLSASIQLHTEHLTSIQSTLTGTVTTVGTQNYSGLSVFVVSPPEGTLAPGKSQDITVTFQPDHESPFYSDRLSIHLMNKQTVCVLDLKGGAHRHTMFLSGGDPLEVSCESLLPPPHTLRAGDTEGGDVRPLLLTMRSEWSGGIGAPALCQLEVGCIQSSQATAKKNAEFVWENQSALQQKGFTVEPARGTVESGSRCTITVTWTPPCGLRPYEVVQANSPLTLKGDVTEVYSVTLMAFT
ncbi:cilia- and flagella-associated protein 74 isoform X2 [Denticeps clupeoides]|uniref:cilia- and flagella-associated protein 74 isoform X2 n=1 Tax=Denticeps clupeoides TaxID=299321 RepID=UPI0010A4E51E|nr:cilia- and flagella-associated protein 74 isoform X2 [Denticeps clupeoides]